MLSIKDSKGKEVFVGSYVKILDLDSDDFQFLDEKELSNTMSIVSSVLEVYEINDYKQAWVEEYSIDNDENYASNSVGLSSLEI
jgi:hypothetical protein